MVFKRVIFLTLSFALSLSAFAGPTDSIKEYSAKVNEAALSFKRLAKEAKGDKERILQSKTFKELSSKFGLAQKDTARLAQAIAEGRSNVVTAIYASIAAKQLIEQNQIESREMDSAIIEIAQMAAISEKGVASDKNLKLTSEEMKDASAALKKKTEYTIEMLTWTKEDAETHVAVMRKTAEIYSKSTTSPEEALVLAIMEVKGVDKDGALKIIRKLRDCV
jgi:hypothetical protein